MNKRGQKVLTSAIIALNLLLLGGGITVAESSDLHLRAGVAEEVSKILNVQIDESLSDEEIFDVWEDNYADTIDMGSPEMMAMSDDEIVEMQTINYIDRHQEVEIEDWSIENKASITVKFDKYNVTVKSGASVDTLNKILKNTYLEGYGQLYYDLENQYGINALFSIGNSITETGWRGNNYLAIHNNNIYGLNMDRVFENKADCIIYWYKLIHNYYVEEGRTSIVAIGKKYCPPNWGEWSKTIPSVVDILINKANVTME